MDQDLGTTWICRENVHRALRRCLDLPSDVSIEAARQLTEAMFWAPWDVATEGVALQLAWAWSQSANYLDKVVKFACDQQDVELLLGRAAALREAPAFRESSVVVSRGLCQYISEEGEHAVVELTALVKHLVPLGQLYSDQLQPHPEFRMFAEYMDDRLAHRCLIPIAGRAYLQVLRVFERIETGTLLHGLGRTKRHLTSWPARFRKEITDEIAELLELKKYPLLMEIRLR